MRAIDDAQYCSTISIIDLRRQPDRPDALRWAALIGKTTIGVVT